MTAGLLGVIVVAGLVFLYWQRFYGAGYPSSLPESPEQPIAFSHKLHAGELQIDCVYCHSRAEKTPIAALPSVKKCQECHAAQEKGGFEGEASRIADFWRDKKPIPWIRVHDLPDHAYFSHRVHLAAELECSTCHGDVSQMERIRRVQSLSMGWCMDCHQERKVAVDCSTCHI
jgi:hypothetical protein